MAELSELLRERGYDYQFSSEKLEDITDHEKRTVYLGIDPTADSLHVGHLQAMLVLRRFLECGHKVILLIGGGTGMIGDPSGKSEERNLLEADTVEKNAKAIGAQARRLFGGLDFILANNADWLGKLHVIEFLRDIGKHFSVNVMLSRDSVKERLGTAEQGISYTEFSYMLLQSYDYLHLHQEYGCNVQIGASDQWGNITSGIDLIRRKTGHTVYGITSPLLINKATGKKFGKSEGGAVWLDPQKTSPFQFYQFWLNTDDNSVEEYFLKMTLVQKDEIATVLKEHSKDPAARSGQKALARAVTSLVHGGEAAASTERVSEALFGDSLEGLSIDDQKILTEEAPLAETHIGELLLDVLVRSSLASSKTEARRFLDDGAIALNGGKVTDTNRLIMREDFQNNPFALLKRGKRNVSILKLK